MTPNPTLRQLACFQALARTGSFSKAATSLGVSQPSLSQQIRNLEAVLGLTLVERGQRSKLTPAGRDLLPMCQSVLGGVDALQARAEQLGKGTRRRLRLGSSPTVGPYLLPQVASNLRAKSQGLSLEITEDTTLDLIERFRRDEFDLILTQLPVTGDDVIAQRLFRERLALVLPKDHRLAEIEALSLTDLAGENMVTLGPRYGLHGLTASICQTYGARLMSDYVGNNLDALRRMVALRVGLALLPSIFAATTISPQDPDVMMRWVPDRAMWRSIGLVARKKRDPLPEMALLTDLLRATAQRDYAAQIVVEG